MYGVAHVGGCYQRILGADLFAYIRAHRWGGHWVQANTGVPEEKSEKSWKSEYKNFLGFTYPNHQRF